jgi:hypothetical protein
LPKPVGMKKEIIPIHRIAQAIRWIRAEKVMLDFDLAVLYGVTKKVLNHAVKRNRERFPYDFMFQLTPDEMANLRSQFVTSSTQAIGNQEPAPHGGRRHRSYAFTEQGIAPMNPIMLSSVLNSERAVKVNIAIMRAFVKLRQMLDSNRGLAQKFSELEKRVGKHDQEITVILEAIRQLMAPPEKPPREIGFHVREKGPQYRARKRA